MKAEIAGDWKQAALAREFIAALCSDNLGTKELIEGRSAAERIAWAEDRAAAMDPMGQGPDQLSDDVGAVRTWTYLGR